MFGSAIAIQKIFSEAGFPENLFSLNLIIPVESRLSSLFPILKFKVLRLQEVKGAGRAVASLAGKFLKKTVLELGGSDPFIVLKDADLEEACAIGTASRMLNAGQVCIAAKRFIVEKEVLPQFIQKFTVNLEKLKLGDPMKPKTDIGPMARHDLVRTIDKQVKESIKMGARLITGGAVINESFYAPTLLTEVVRGMPVCDEETFGPVATVIVAENAEDAIIKANDTEFGLGASVWTKDFEIAEHISEKLDVGSVFINGMVKSDPRLPFGGTKQSGYGRELSKFGAREFVNLKTVWFK